MRQLLILSILSLTIIVGSQSTVMGGSIQDYVDAKNYSFGFRFGMNVRKYNLEFRPEILWHGFFAPIDEIPPQFDRKRMDDVLKKLSSRQRLPKLTGNELQERIEVQNYSIGYQLGTDFLVQNIPLRPQALWDGLFDGFYGKPEPQLPLEEMAVILEEMEILLMQQDQAQDQQPLTVTGQHFLSSNAKMKGVNVLKSGLQYRVLKAGTGKSPQVTDSVLVNFRSRTIEGLEFSSSFPFGDPMPKKIRVDSALPGWTEALPLMREGAKWELYMPAYLAYKDSGPLGGQVIISYLELIKVLSEPR